MSFLLHVVLRCCDGGGPKLKRVCSGKQPPQRSGPAEQQEGVVAYMYMCINEYDELLIQCRIQFLSLLVK